MTPPRWKAVLFDFGGTLDGDGIHWSRRFDATFRGMGLGYSPEGLDRAFSASEKIVNTDPAVRTMNLPASIEYQCELMLADLGHPGRPLAIEAGRRLTEETRGYLVRNAGVLKMLRGVARTAILSNFTGNLEIILREEGLLPLVDHVFDSGVMGLRKPDPAIFLLALERLGASAAESAMVGDSVENDLRPARELGLATVWIRSPGARPSDFQADHTLGSVLELPNIWG